MKNPSHRELFVEMASLLVVFTAAFLVGESVTSRTGNVWWGISAGSLTFVETLPCDDSTGEPVLSAIPC